MRNATIYLAGQIAMDKRTYLWRNDFVYWCAGFPEITIINPCDTEFDKVALSEGDRDQHGYNSAQMAEDAIILLPHIDYGHVTRRADIVIFDLNHYDKRRPMVGTLFEMAWAFTCPELMVIGVIDGDPKENPLCRHPFVQETIQIWRPDHRAAFETVLRHL